MTKEEQQEFKTLVLPHLEELHRTAYHLCHVRCNAEDLVMETVTKACEKFRNLREKTKIKHWLLRILSNTFISSYRSQKGLTMVEYTETTHDDGGGFSLFAELSQPFLLWWGNPERELVNKLMDEEIQKAIGELPQEFRLAIVLCDVEGLSYDEIATMTDVPIGTVRSRIARGRSLLQKKLYHYAQDLGLIHAGRKIHDKAKEFQSEH
ncbi:MAG: sigma-70 family RNA polymerase sigma factor [Ignavibacteriales bacterium]|nr:sigma-70 family RNA polymerase sigma factor [Ignavibacteriales bacterium]